MSCVSSSDGELSGNRFKRSKDCSSTFKNLDELKREIAKRIGEEITTETECEALILKTINVSSKLRNKLKRNAPEIDQHYNETLAELNKDFKEFSKQITSINPVFKLEYMKVYDESSQTIKTSRQSIETAIKKQGSLNAKLDFYSLYLKSEEAVNKNDETICPLMDERGAKIISILNEITAVLKGQSSTDNCEILIKRMTNVDSLINQHKLYNEKQLELYNQTYAERKRIVQNILDDDALGSRDFEGLKGNFSELNQRFSDINQENEIIRNKIAKKSFELVIKLIREGKDFSLVKSALEDASIIEENTFTKAVTNAYNCDDKNIQNVIRFMDFNGRLGYANFKDKMDTCGHMENPMLLKIAHTLKDDTLKPSVNAIYKNFAEEIRNKNSENFLDFFQKVYSDIIDWEKLIQLTYNRDVNNTETLTQFIEKLEIRDKKLETILYDQMMNSGHVDTVEHVMFAFWLKKRIHFIELQNIHASIIDAQKRSLEEVKQRLPEGIRFLIFEPSIIFATENFEYLMRAFSLDSVRFKAIPANEGRYFRFNDTFDDRSLFLTPLGGYNVVMIGKGHLTTYYWQIVPIDNGQLFIIRNKSNGYVLSSQEYKVCALWEDNWVFKNKCKSWEYYNMAYPPTFLRETEKWMITTTLIRNKMLKDRTKIRN